MATTDTTAPQNFPPPPTSVNPTTGERIAGGLSGALNAAVGLDPNNTPIDQEIQKHQQARLDEAKMHRQNAATYAGILHTGIDPQTGQSLTPEQKQTYQNQFNAAWSAYEKVAGVDKNTKGALAKMRAVAQHLIGAGAQGAPQQKGLPQPPATQAAPQQTANKLPPPPAYGPEQQAAAPMLEKEMQTREDQRLAQQDWKPVPNSDLEINPNTGETRKMKGATPGSTKERDAITSAMAKQGYNVTFGPNGDVASLTPIPGFKNPQRDKLTANLAARGETPIFDDAGNVTGVQPLPGYLDFQQQLAKAKQGTSKNAGLTMYAAYRFYDEAVQHNPGLLPYVAPMIQNALAQSGVKTPAGFVDALAKLPPNMPQDEFGNAIGIKMPGSPLASGAVNQGGLYAQRFIKQEPEIRKEIKDNSQWLGPVHGRMAVKYLLYKVGSTGDPKEDRALAKLRTDLELTDTNVARMHINSVKAIEGVEQLSDAGKMSPGALLGALDSIHEWAQDAAEQGQGRSIFKNSGTKQNPGMPKPPVSKNKDANPLGINISPG